MGTTAQKLSYLKETKEKIMERVNNIDGAVSDNTTFRQGIQKVVDVYNYYNNASETITPIAKTDKIEYLQETKRTYKEAINLFNEGITDNTTFREYIDKLDDIYDNLPKYTIEGNDFKIEDTKAGKVAITPKGNIEQYYPLGYNLLPYRNTTQTRNGLTFTNHGDGTFSINGTASAQTIYCINAISESGTVMNMKLESTSYKVSVDQTMSDATFFVQLAYKKLDTTTGYISVQTDGGNINNLSIQDIDNNAGLSLIIRQGVKFSDVLFKPMLQLATTSYSFEPYTNGTVAPSPSYPQKTRVITGNNTVTYQGKNLFNKNATPEVVGKYITKTGTQTSNDEFSIYKIMVRGNTKYTITNKGQSSSPGVCIYGENDNFLSGVNYANHSTVTFTTPASAKYVLLSVATLSTSLRYELDIFQLEKGDSATSYENYVTPVTKSFNLENLELAKIQDINYVDNNKLTKITNINTIKNNLIITNELTNANASNITIGIPDFSPEVGKYYISADIKLKSGTTTLNNIQMWSRSSWTASAKWITQPTISNDFQRFVKEYTISNIGDVTNTIYAFYIQLINSTNAILEIKNIQISKVNEPYAPYGTNADLIFKNEITNPYYDNTLIENAWYKKEKIGKAILNGNNSHGMYQNIYYIVDIDDYARNNNIPICNYFKGENNKTGVSDTFELNAIAFNKDYNNNRLYINVSSISTAAADIVNWLNTHKPVVYYLKDNPTNIQITNTTLIEQLEELNKVIGQGGTVVIETDSEVRKCVINSKCKRITNYFTINKKGG